jgi:hypothetical protein
MATCIDDPAVLLQKDWCVSALSKDLEGALGHPDSKAHQCPKPPCKTLKTVQSLNLKVAAHAPCDSKPSAALDGPFVIERLVTVFDTDGLHRGYHAGDFVWHGAAGVTVTGRISGVTNVGSHRAPAFSACQKCDDKGVMEGRLCGTIASPNNPALNGCQVVGDYRIKFDPGANGGQGAVRGTLEGVILCTCSAAG